MPVPMPEDFTMPGEVWLGIGALGSWIAFQGAAIVKAFIHQKTGKGRREGDCVALEVHDICSGNTKQALTEIKEEMRTGFDRIHARLDDIAQRRIAELFQKGGGV